MLNLNIHGGPFWFAAILSFSNPAGVVSIQPMWVLLLIVRENSWYLIGCSVYANDTLIGWILDIFLDIKIEFEANNSKKKNILKNKIFWISLSTFHWTKELIIDIFLFILNLSTSWFCTLAFLFLFITLVINMCLKD